MIKSKRLFETYSHAKETLNSVNHATHDPVADVVNVGCTGLKYSVTRCIMALRKIPFSVTKNGITVHCVPELGANTIDISDSRPKIFTCYFW